MIITAIADAFFIQHPRRKSWSIVIARASFNARSSPTAEIRSIAETICTKVDDQRFGNLDVEWLVTDDQIVAVALLTEQDLQSLGPTFARAWPVEDAAQYSELLNAIDEADRGLRRKPHWSSLLGTSEG